MSRTGAAPSTLGPSPVSRFGWTQALLAGKVKGSALPKKMGIDLASKLLMGRFPSEAVGKRYAKFGDSKVGFAGEPSMLGPAVLGRCRAPGCGSDGWGIAGRE